MGDSEHTKVLNRGVDYWNKWREDNPYVEPDLSGAILQQRFYLNWNLAGVNFSNTNLDGVDLYKSDLSRSNLRGASLLDTYLGYSNLSYSDFEDALFGLTMLGHTDLSNASGLDSCTHARPSFIDPQTIIISGELPIEFLRGCGVPDEFITYVRSLVSHPIQFYSCFISYSSKDQDFAERLYADLQNRGVRCWFAPEDIKIGDVFRTRIDESIRIYDKLLLVLSENSVSSQWVEKEVETAMEREREQNKTILFPVRLDDTVNEMKVGWPADIRRTRHIGDFTRWKDHDSYQKAFDRLLRDLKAEG